MPKWVCTVCGTEHRVLCTPGKCAAYHNHGSCCPKKCKNCGAPAEKMVMGGLPPGQALERPELGRLQVAPTGPPESGQGH